MPINKSILAKWKWKYVRMKNVLKGKDFYVPLDHRANILTLGDGYNAWTFIPDLLDKHSIVYSFGVGEDISFDLALMKRFHLSIYAYDPTPKSQKWLAQQSIPENFVYKPIGVADRNGMVTFKLPDNTSHVSGQIVHTQTTNTIEVEVMTLSNIMKMNGHHAIDMLKMDIEGSEYMIIDDMLNQAIPVKQLLVEFHHRFDHIGINKSKTTINKLKKAGYKLFHVSDTGEEYSFLKE